MAAADVTIGAFPEQVIGGYPPEDLSSGAPSSTSSAPSSSASRARPPTPPRSSSLGLAVAVGGQIFNCAAVVHGGRILGFVPKEKLPTYNVFYEARTFSRGGAAGARRRRRAARRPPLRLRLRPGRGRGLRGRLVARRADAPPLLLGRRGGGQPLVLAVPRGRRRHAPRDARHARGRQPGAGLRQHRRRAGRAHLRRRRLRLPERPPVLDAPRFREGWSPPSSISTAPAACARRTPPGGPTARSSGCSADVPVIACDGATPDRRSCRTRRPRATASSCRARRPRRRSARRRARRPLRGARPGRRDYYGKTGAFRCSASRSPAAATRC